MSVFGLRIHQLIERTIDSRFENDGAVKDLVALGKPVHFSFSFGSHPEASEQELSNALKIFLDERLYEHPIKILISQKTLAYLMGGGAASIDADVMVPVSNPTRYEIYREASFWISLFLMGKAKSDRFVEGIEPVIDERSDQEFHDGIPVYRLVII